MRLKKELTVTERTARVASSVGLHARPASLFVQAVKATGLPVTIGTQTKPAGDARSILWVMGLGAKHGDMVTLGAEGPDAEEALDGLVELLEKDLDAD